MNTEADNTQNETTNAPTLIESLTWQLNNRIKGAAGGYYPEISLDDVYCEITRTVTQSATLNLSDVSDMEYPQNDVYDWEDEDEDIEDEVWRVTGMIRRSDYSDLLARYTNLIDLVRTAIPLVDIHRKPLYKNGVSEE